MFLSFYSAYVLYLFLFLSSVFFFFLVSFVFFRPLTVRFFYHTFPLVSLIQTLPFHLVHSLYLLNILLYLFFLPVVPTAFPSLPIISHRPVPVPSNSSSLTIFTFSSLLFTFSSLPAPRRLLDRHHLLEY